MPRAPKRKRPAAAAAAAVTGPSAPSTTPADASPSSSSSSEPIFFYGPANPYGELSQHYAAAFTVDGISYTSGEQYMMHAKALLFAGAGTGDPESLAYWSEQILGTADPKRCKALGRQIPNFDDEVWAREREEVVFRGNLAKFSHDRRLRELLLATGQRELVEAAPRDRVWGIGFGHQRALAVGRERWGRNLLGICLMRVRDQLRMEGDNPKVGEGRRGGTVEAA